MDKTGCIGQNKEGTLVCPHPIPEVPHHESTPSLLRCRYDFGPICELERQGQHLGTGPPVLPREILTILIHCHQNRCRDFKSHCTLHVQRHLCSEFPGLFRYARFVALMPRVLAPLYFYLTRIMATRQRLCPVVSPLGARALGRMTVHHPLRTTDAPKNSPDCGGA